MQVPAAKEDDRFCGPVWIGMVLLISSDTPSPRLGAALAVKL
jgi:hypothetical protein